MSAFANAPPKGSRPKQKPVEEEEGTPIPNLYLHLAAPVTPTAPPPVARVSEKRQKELDAISKMMEDEEEPQGPRLLLITNRLTSELEDFPPDDIPAASAPQEDSQDTALSGETPMATPPSQDPKRKRGKRKVLKKTTKRDEKGYLGSCSPNSRKKKKRLIEGVVTKNEYVYESYSEDDEEVMDEKVVKKSVPVTTKTEGEKKKGKGAGAAGQKSLMSFYGKKWTY